VININDILGLWPYKTFSVKGSLLDCANFSNYTITFYLSSPASMATYDNSHYKCRSTEMVSILNFNRKINKQKVLLPLLAKAKSFHYYYWTNQAYSVRLPLRKAFVVLARKRKTKRVKGKGLKRKMIKSKLRYYETRHGMAMQ